MVGSAYLASLVRGMDPTFEGRFKLEWEGLWIGSFAEVTGLSAEVEVETYQEGGQNEFEIKLPGRMSWPNLVFKRGITNNDGLFEWFRKTSGDGFSGRENRLQRRTGHISVLNPKGRAIREWTIHDAFPVRWSGPTLASSSSSIAMEELEVAHHGFKPE